MGKIINLFNHKGGVSETTTVFNLAWMLGKMGKKVIVADFDPQCNLTGMVLGYKGVEDLEGTYTESPPNNIFAASKNERQRHEFFPPDLGENSTCSAPQYVQEAHPFNAAL